MLILGLRDFHDKKNPLCDDNAPYLVARNMVLQGPDSFLLVFLNYQIRYGASPRMSSRAILVDKSTVPRLPELTAPDLHRG